MRNQTRDDGILPFLWVLLASVTALLLAFSQTAAFFGDEGFHLLAAQLVNTGRRLYLDFFYPHAPLFAYSPRPGCGSSAIPGGACMPCRRSVPPAASRW